MGTYSGQIRGLDLPSIYMAAQRTKQLDQEAIYKEQEFQRQQAELQRQKQLREMYGRYLRTGDEESVRNLQRMDPQGFLAVQKQQLEQQGLQQQQQARTQDQAAERLATIGNTLRSLDKIPDDYKGNSYVSMRNYLIQSGITDPSSIPEQYDPQWVASALQQADAIHQLRQNRAEDTPQQRNFNYLMSLPPDKREQFMSILKSGGININTGDMALSTPNITKAQEEITNIDDTIRMLDQLGSYDPKVYNTGWGQARTKLAEFADKWANPLLPSSEKQRLSNAKTSEIITETIGLQIQKATTGLSGAGKELDRIMRTSINSEQGPTAFETARLFTKDKLLAVKRARQALLREGIDLDNPNTYSNDPAKIQRIRDVDNQLSSDIASSYMRVESRVDPSGGMQRMSDAATRAKQLDDERNPDGSKRYNDQQIHQILIQEKLAR